MVLETIFIARHGYRSNWVDNPIPEPPTGIDSDHILAEHGEEQAKELASAILTEPDKPDLVFSSPLYRCIQTSLPISDALQTPINVENGVGEWYRPDRNVIPRPATLSLLNNFFKHHLNQDWKSVISPSENGESEDDIFQRCKKFWPLFFKKLDELYPDAKSLIIVCHAASKIALGMTLMGFNSVRDEINFIDELDNSKEVARYLKAGTCSLDKYSLQNNDGKRSWKLIYNGRTDFLSKGEEMNWHFMDKVEAGSAEDIKQRKLKAAAIKEAEAEAEKKNEFKNNDDEEYEEFFVSLTFPNIQIKKEGSIEKSTDVESETRKRKTQSYARGNEANRTTYSRNVYSTHSTRSTASEMEDSPTTSILNRDAKMRIYGITHETPWVILSDDLSFTGEWKKLIGTELIIDNNGKCLGKIKHHIDLTHGILSENGQKTEESTIQRLRRGESLYEKALLLATECELDKKKRERRQKRNLVK